MSTVVETSAPSGSKGRPPIDPRIRARRVEIRRSAGRRRLRRVLVVAAILGAVLLAALSTLSPLLDVDRIQVTGLYRTPLDTVVKAGRIHPGDPLVTVDLHRAERGVAALPWVRSVRATRHWPGTIHYEIRERVPAAAVAGADGRWYVADRDGRLLLIVADQPTGLVTVTGTHPTGRVGYLPSRDRAALAVAGALPPSVQSLASSVAVTAHGALVQLHAGGTILVGDGGHLAAKGVAMATVLANVDPSCVTQLDVAVPDTPVLTRVPGCG